jgi:hypothetical protein
MKTIKGCFKKIIGLMLILNTYTSLAQMGSYVGSIKGTATDEATGESLPGVTVIVEGTTLGASANVDGQFEIRNLKPGTYNLKISYISYNPRTITGIVIQPGRSVEVKVTLSQDAVELEDVMITAERKTNSEASVINTVRMSPLVSIGISGQQILRSQDKDASEVIRRLPGTSIVDDRFIIVRGLAQRYNSVWLNNAATPSSEADVKAFSFDVIPASIIDHMMIIKSPAPELPADFSGGFIKISTIVPPEKNSFFLSYGTGYGEGTTFNNFLKSSTSPTNFLGFSNKRFDLPGDMPDNLGQYETASNPEIRNRITSLGRTLANSWVPQSTTAMPDQRASAGFSRRFRIGSQSIGNITSLTYSNTRNHDEVEINNYSIYDYRNDKSSFNDQFLDEQYTNSIKTGIMHNWLWFPPSDHRIEFRNLLNEIGQSRITIRNGREWYNDGRFIRSSELKNLSRTIYSGQLAGDHTFNKTKIDWVAGYSFANKNEPDIRRYRYIRSDTDVNEYFMLFSDNPDLSSQSRMWFRLSEEIYSVSVNLTKKYDLNGFLPEMKAGFYYEDKYRKFSARNFGYARAGNASLFSRTSLPADEVFVDDNINLTDGIRLSEITSLSDSYDASNNLFAGYIALKIPVVSAVSLYTGFRIEKNKQSLSSYRQGTTIPVNVSRDTVNIFPSVNLSILLNKKNTIRLAYGLSVNRPEFREMAPFYFVDFDLNAGIYGNPEIEEAFINNYDLRFEHYPSPDENLNIELFFKTFKNPIEMIIMGNNPSQYSFQNVKSAYSYGIEADIRKTFRFLSADENFSFIMNAALISSKVNFGDGDINPDRPLQGQSPFMVNTGLFYYNDKNGFMVTALYNIIGSRIIAVGRPSPNTWESIPDITEMPRNVFDLMISKKIGSHLEIKGSFKDLLNSRVLHIQKVNATVDMNDLNGPKKFKRDQVSRDYRPGRTVTLSISYKF